ncbi:unnamed protein product [Bursaphelenchus xylophilus]|nr:unnamed protein product [Bursaphelenchus xylophilus]CAG9131708.1 unnamed protein product [Bursaphelenchus xylophilus]
MRAPLATNLAENGQGNDEPTPKGEETKTPDVSMPNLEVLGPVVPEIRGGKKILSTSITQSASFWDTTPEAGTSAQSEAYAGQEEDELNVEEPKKKVRRTAALCTGPMATPLESFTTSGRHVSVGTSQRNNPIYYTASNRYKGFGYKFSKNENKTNKAGTSVRVICVQCKLLGGRSKNTVNTTTMMLKSDPDEGKHICMERGHGFPINKVLMEQQMRSVNQLVKKHPNAITPQEGSEMIYNKVKECFEGHPQQSAILGKLKTNIRQRMMYHANTSAVFEETGPTSWKDDCREIMERAVHQDSQDEAVPPGDIKPTTSEPIPDYKAPEFDDDALNDALEAIAASLRQELSPPHGEAYEDIPTTMATEFSDAAPVERPAANRTRKNRHSL